MDKMTLKDFAQKIEWEGGLRSSLDYFGEVPPTITGVAVKDRVTFERLWREAHQAITALEGFYEAWLERKGVIVE